MERLIYLLDSSIFIEYFRARDKTMSLLDQLDPPRGSAMSAVTLMELEIGTITPDHRTFLNRLLQRYPVLPFDGKAATIAGRLHRQLREVNRQLDIPDLIIASVAIANSLPLATLNDAHFARVPGLRLLTK